MVVKKNESDGVVEITQETLDERQGVFSVKEDKEIEALNTFTTRIADMRSGRTEYERDRDICD